MSHPRHLARLSVALKPSCGFLIAFVLVHTVAACIALGTVSTGIWGAAICVVLVLSAAWHIPRGVLLRHPAAVIGLRLAGEDECTLLLRGGLRFPGRILPSSYVTRHLIVLVVGLPGRRIGRRVVIWPDSAATEVRRRLRVRLRWTNPDRREEVHMEAPL